uniref:Uncharacterized protein n=1 Tax=Anguilla anguilla TaxID=7936 RepID=A0A0E9RRE1_ANGAN
MLLLLHTHTHTQASAGELWYNRATTGPHNFHTAKRICGTLCD